MVWPNCVLAFHHKSTFAAGTSDSGAGSAGRGAMGNTRSMPERWARASISRSLRSPRLRTWSRRNLTCSSKLVMVLSLALESNNVSYPLTAARVRAFLGGPGSVRRTGTDV